MINKKMSVLALAFAALAMTACGGGNKGGQGGGTDSQEDWPEAHYNDAALTGSESITYWCPETDSEFLAGLVADFKTANPDWTGDITLLSNMSEGDVKTNLTKDLEAAADLFEIADDNIRGCVAARALTPLTAEELAVVRYADGGAAANAFAVGSTYYGYSYRADNGYVLYYDKQIISDEQAKSVEGIIAACEAAGAVFDWNITTGWYAPAPLFANGVKLYYDAEGTFNADDLDSEKAKKAMLALNAAWKGHVGVSVLDNLETSKFGVEGTGRVGACIKWNDYGSFATAVGAENVGVAPLPTLKIDGVDKPLFSFQGYKGVAIKAGLSEGKLAVARAFAHYMTGEAAQEKRLTELGHGVSNKAVIAKKDLWDNPHLLALAQMTAAGHVVSQCGATNENFWDAMTALMETVSKQTLTDANVGEVLKAAKKAIIAE